MASDSSLAEGRSGFMDAVYATRGDDRDSGERAISGESEKGDRFESRSGLRFREGASRFSTERAFHWNRRSDDRKGGLRNRQSAHWFVDRERWFRNRHNRNSKSAVHEAKRRSRNSRSEVRREIGVFGFAKDASAFLTVLLTPLAVNLAIRDTTSRSICRTLYVGARRDRGRRGAARSAERASASGRTAPASG